MAASRLGSFFGACKLKYFIYLCIAIGCIQFYMGFRFAGFFENNQHTTEVSHENQNIKHLHTKRLESYKNFFAASKEIHQSGRPSYGTVDWNPDKMRKFMIDAIYDGSKLQCSLDSNNKDAISAYIRAKTPECKEAIQRVGCLLDNKRLFPAKLPRFCPLKGSGEGEHVGCYKDVIKDRDIKAAKSKSTENTPQSCINMCLASGYSYAGVEYGEECWCGDSYGKHGSISQSACDYPCPSNATLKCGGLNAVDVYKTGFGSRPSGEQNEALTPSVLNSDTNNMVRILFMFTWNGRGWRQVKRLFKQMYHVNHYYYIHVDAREEYLYRQVLTLTQQYDNVRVVRRRIGTIWGGASLLQMLLQTMKEALDMTDWRWDFYLNLSESDYPVKSVEQLTAFLTANKGKNFLKSHGPDTPMFLRKQGLLRAFYECDYHLWRVGNRTVPTGIRIDGGSDWICLSRDFIRYVTSSQDELVTGLNEYFSYALLPAESYFHTVLQNSKFCESFVDNNLHKTNWNRKRGCLCQYKHIVDWCGCSPLDFSNTNNDKDKLMGTSQTTFFARKFEAVVNNGIVNWLDEWLHPQHKTDFAGKDSYWQSVYHEDDSWKKTEDSQYTYYMSLGRNTVKKVVRVNAAGQCQLNLNRIRQVHLLNENDKFSGMLAHFTASPPSGADNAKSVEWEVHLKPRDQFKLIKPFGDISRVTQIMVGSIFDMKERLFRDYGQMLGSMSPNLTVVQNWQAGLEVNVTLVLTDSLLRIAYAHNITVPQGMDNLVVTKVYLAKPMLPGQWKAKLVYQNVLVAETSFLVLPELYNQRKLASQVNYYSMTNNYRIAPDIIALYSDIVTTLDEKPSINESLLAQYPSSLLQWADDFVDLYWKPHGACVLTPNTGCDLIPVCNATNWSSFSPDPKSEIGPIDPKTGKIIQGF